MNVDVLIVGAGPTGLMLANELRLGGVNALVVEREAVRSGQSKALNLQPRTAEVLDMRGLLEPLMPRAISHVVNGHFAGLPEPLSYAGLGTRHPYQVGIPQARTEDYLEQQVSELVRRGHPLTGLTQHADHVEAEVDGLGTITARYLVACDGGHSTVRKQLGTPFDGRSARVTFAIMDVVLSGEDDALPPPWRSMKDTFASVDSLGGWAIPIGDGLYRLASFAGKGAEDKDLPVTFEETRAVLAGMYGDKVTLEELRYGSRFSDATRQVRSYRDGQVFYAGDAAHIHMPAGGQGLNLGMQDAFNLGWKLVAVLGGKAQDALLDTYHAERHPVGARVLENTKAQAKLMELKDDAEDGQALRKTFVDLLGIPETNRYLAGMISGLDIHYGDRDELAGARIPDHDLADGSRLYERLHPGDWVSVTVDEAPELEADTVLLRPDGYVHWAGDRSGLDHALATRFGAELTNA